MHILFLALFLMKDLPGTSYWLRWRNLHVWFFFYILVSFRSKINTFMDLGDISKLLTQRPLAASILTPARVRTHLTTVPPVLVINISPSLLLLTVLICAFWKQKVRQFLSCSLRYLSSISEDIFTDDTTKISVCHLWYLLKILLSVCC